ncbi:MAG: hypothetical protein RL885_14185 [Planctomycetota bacterium]
MVDPLLFFQLGVTWTLVGLIWVIQVVHYPLFAAVGEQHFNAYHRSHSSRITWLVGPLMVSEALLATMLLLRDPSDPLLLSGLVLVVLLFASTAFIQVPLHHRLTRGLDPLTVRRLVATNWIRTVAWSLRGILAVALLIGEEPLR